ncbi:MAG: hypothetical protein JXB04_00140 [Kiritimatiellae bacterium]|nr:hypothetical protein [Kiritimatiellia bacterium]
MNPLNKLTKEQKQMAILATLLTFGALFALYQFVLKRASVTFKESKSELADIRKKLEQAEQSLNKKDKLAQQLAEVTAELRRSDEQYIPPLENTLSWATEFVYRHARAVEVPVETVNEVKGGNVPWGVDKKKPRYFTPYAVRVVAACGYYEFVKLIEVMERSNPYVFVSDIAIAGQINNPMVQRVQFTLEWPIWKDKSGSSIIKGLKKTGTAPQAAVPPGQDRRSLAEENMAQPAGLRV